MLNDRLLRAALVTIACEPGECAQAESEEETTEEQTDEET